MAMLFVIEDSAKDLSAAEVAARTVGFTSVVKNASTDVAFKLLSTMLSDSSKLPDAFLIDLDLGHESGYEILRLRHATPTLSRIPAVVWTRFYTNHQEMCEVFGINQFVHKGDGIEALKTALHKMIPA
jgi:response regulator RpfG family c-di-GMP phosphodiesterase